MGRNAGSGGSWEDGGETHLIVLRRGMLARRSMNVENRIECDQQLVIGAEDVSRRGLPSIANLDRHRSDHLVDFVYFPFRELTANSASERVIRHTFRSPERDNIPTELLLFLLAKRQP
jgi:hypothetical protein